MVTKYTHILMIKGRQLRFIKHTKREEIFENLINEELQRTGIVEGPDCYHHEWTHHVED